MHSVRLAISQVVVAGCQPTYHSSVIVDGEEFAFGRAGISSGNIGPASHGGSRPKLIDRGSSHRSGTQLRAALAPHFRPHTWDARRKSCHSFSDCALVYLLGCEQRLDPEYFVEATLPMEGYIANPRASEFDLEMIVACLACDLSPRHSQEHAAAVATPDSDQATPDVVNVTKTADHGNGAVATGASADGSQLVRVVMSETYQALELIVGALAAARRPTPQGLPFAMARNGATSTTDWREDRRSELLDASTTTMTFVEPSSGGRCASSADGECAVCWDVFRQGEEIRILPCLHRYHKACVDMWLVERGTCPMCKRAVGR